MWGRVLESGDVTKVIEGPKLYIWVCPRDPNHATYSGAELPVFETHYRGEVQLQDRRLCPNCLNYFGYGVARVRYLITAMEEA